MSNESYLFAAYVATWLIHLGYIAHLVSRARKIRNEVSELQASTGNRPGSR